MASVSLWQAHGHNRSVIIYVTIAGKNYKNKLKINFMADFNTDIKLKNFICSVCDVDTANEDMCDDCRIHGGEEIKKCKDMADVCELAHTLTAQECKKNNYELDCISPTQEDGECAEHSESEAHYSNEAQSIFDAHYDYICEVINI